MPERQHNQRKWDGTLFGGISLTAIVSSLWGLGVYLSNQVVTQSELQRQQYYTDYQVSKLRLDTIDIVIQISEGKMDAGIALTAREKRRYERFIAERPALQQRVNTLASTF